jgi:hypothetical protein
VKLASHDILSVRQAAWAFFDKSEARIREKMAEASRIVDAKWEDSRALLTHPWQTPPLSGPAPEGLAAALDRLRQLLADSVPPPLAAAN